MESESPEALVEAGNLLAARGELGSAVELYRRALARRPDSVAIQSNLGSVLRRLGDWPGAVDCYQRALAIDPASPQSHNNLGNLLLQMGRPDEAEKCYEAAISLRPDFAEAYNNLGKAHDDRGEIDEAIAYYRRAVSLAPTSARIHSNLVYALHFHPTSTRASLYAEHRRWNERHARPLVSSWRAYENDRSLDRPLRVGYLSPDFCLHAVGRFMLPLLRGHDPSRVTSICYASQAREDEFTARLQQHAQVWRNVLSLDDAQLAEQIRADRVDILVDLSMHMAGNRLGVFARRPAPVQVTYLAYCSTTGLDAMDYRLTHRHLDPLAGDGRHYSERSIELPSSYWCYEPGATTPKVGDLPAPRRGGQITFGCLNNFCKVTRSTLCLWRRLLSAMPRSRLLLHCHAGERRQEVRDFMLAGGVAADRITFADFAPLERYFKFYEEIDIALDPFPYGGGTTTCDALWMGVPVISLAGRTAVSRSGRTLLTAVGLPELAVATPARYLRVALNLAANLPRLARLRRSLRLRMQQSPLMDSQAFTRDVEAAYEMMWRGR
jgi:predicted O-linked N-acetylglucosamine transferase (SPINDLY family)